ncbi:zinc finger domain-like protein [Leptomonas seymouri]|uniref:Palmitoyltransferase n=1 Tax=Leptomonas seymouri TaxID=5684 RepID=A0A0N1I0A6_LEPSE|nr:zinc finger domain-like protein [Leptomonas seymouri]|eukprot:KPI84105.1 zinc finger domain-like protein [Leptomonas seymouri]
MDNGELLSYTLKRRGFLAMWLMLQQRWHAFSFGSSVRGLSWMIIVLGMVLVTITVVTTARNVVPVLTTPGTRPYYLLQSLVLVVSFNICLNYFCATAFSRRVGMAPADYVYRDPYGEDPAAVPYDDSNENESEEEEQLTAAVSGSAHPLDHTQPHLQPLQHRQVDVYKDGACQLEAGSSHVMAHTVGEWPPYPGNGLPLQAATGASLRKAPPATMTPVPQRPRGIQVVRVFGEEPPSTAARHSREHANGSQRASALPSSSNYPRVDNVMSEAEEENGEDERGTAAGASPPFLVSTRLSRCINHCWLLLLSAATGNRLRRTPLHACSNHCSRFSCARCCDAPPSTVADPSVLRELELLACTAERFGARQRSFRVLDAPRRYCSHCRRLKAPREHHCAICNECVAKMDHHCPWINNCVDAENQRYFILFISWLWIGTLLATAFIGYGVTRQQRYTARRELLYRQWLRSPAKEPLARELQNLRMPYGPSGVLLTSYPTIMVLGISITMLLCMTFFMYFNRRLVLENTTVIESIYVDEKRRHAYRFTGSVYRSPYDLGRWLNFLDMFSTVGDPFVKAVAESMPSQRAGSAGPPARLGTHQRGLLARFIMVVSRVGLVLWLVAFPTFRSTHSDGVHYTTFDALASGEQTSLLQP